MEVGILWRWDIIMHGKTAKLTAWDGSMNIRDIGERNKITASYRLDYSHATANDPSHFS